MNGPRLEWKVFGVKAHEQFKTSSLAKVVIILRSHEEKVTKEVKLVSGMGSLAPVEKGKKATKGDSKSDLSYSEIYNELDLLISNPKKFIKKNFSGDKNKYRDSTLPSPTTTTTNPITIAPCPPVSIEASQPEISTAHTTPLFMDSTAATTTNSSTPSVTVNVSDMGERTYGLSSGVDITPISHLCQDDPDIIFGDGRGVFEDFTYSPFRVQQGSDEDDAPMTTGQFKAINTN
ncbi:hypothetical protein Lser_V15G40914 [Lactuca serriola]